MTARRPLLALIAALALVPAACGSDEENIKAVTEPGQVSMKSFAFVPAEATVKVGEKVTWKNEDSAKHDATGEGSDLKTPLIGQGETTDYTPTKAGTIEYVCSIHPNMKGTLTVTE